MPTKSLIMRPYIRMVSASLSLVLVFFSLALAQLNAQVLLSDSFDAPDSPGVSDASSLVRRQKGSAAPAAYVPVTLFAQNADVAAAKDSTVIKNNALVLMDSRIPGKGPVSLALGKAFTDADGPLLIKATLRPGRSVWTGIKWTPQRNGNWPDISYGIAVTITPGGSWTVWANGAGKLKNVIGHGQVVRADNYPVTLAFSGMADARRFSVLIGDAAVIPETPCTYPWTAHNLVLQTLGGKEGGSAEIDNLLVEKLTKSNDPAVAATIDAAKSVGVWIEGEDAYSTNFYSGKVVSVAETGPSGGMFLRLFTSKGNPKHPQSPYFAKYKVTVPAAGSYILWIASTPQNAAWASPLVWSVDGGNQSSLKGKAWTGATWGKPEDKWAGWVFGWTQAGAIELAAGEHELDVGVVEPRGSSANYVACVDALLLTNSKSFLPVGNHPQYSTQPTWAERMKNSSEREFADSLNHKLYYELIGNTNEQIGADVSAMVLKKIEGRPLPSAADRSPETTEFGLHGMERPFVSLAHNANTPEIARAYDLLARTGVDSLRTADSCWHRLATKEQSQDATRLHLDFGDLDFQVTHAWKYGMTHLFTVGYPPSAMTVADNMLSACAPEHYALYKHYFETVFARYKDQGLRYAEMGNEVDAPDVWWRKSTPAEYVQEMRFVHDAVKETAPNVRTVAVASTYSRDEALGGAKGGRRFVTACFDLGIDNYADAYSLHHMDSLKAKDFPAYFQRELARIGNAGSLKKPLLNTEQNGGSYPYDGAKSFARIFFLYGMPRMDYFLARDFYENGSLLTWGLFDMDWRPKLRLLAYAFSVDAMRGRELVGIARPAPGVEAYVLKRIGSYQGSAGDPAANTEYSIVLWKTDRETNDWTDAARVKPVEVGTGLKGVKAAIDWKLDAVAFDPNSPAFLVGDEPLAIYTGQIPDWTLLTREAYLASVDAGGTEAPLPTSH